jgi:hypothetical protein
MTHYEDPNSVTCDPKKKVVRESFQIHAAKFTLAYRVRFGRVGSFLKKRA